MRRSRLALPMLCLSLLGLLARPAGGAAAVTTAAGAPPPAAAPASAARPSVEHPAPTSGGHAPEHPNPREAAAGVLAQIMKDNTAFVHGHGQAYFQSFLSEQHPRATVVACADSRFHLQAIDSSPDGDIFEIRNIGNQIDVSEGSVEYALYHLRTPLLLIVGHVGCGAVKAAMGDYSDEPPAIRRELDGLHLSLRRSASRGTVEQQWQAHVIGNVHQQVLDAQHEYRELVQKGRLFIVGAVYDFRNDLGEGQGRLHIINVNGETNRARFTEAPLLKDVRRLLQQAR